jgi:hypothetical protein
MAARNEAFSAAVSERALISSGKSAGSLTQPGRKPQRAKQRPAVGAVVALLAAHVAGNDQDRLRRRNIVARREILDLLEPEQFLHLLGVAVSEKRPHIANP